MKDAYVAGVKEVKPDIDSFKIILNAWRKAVPKNEIEADDFVLLGDKHTPNDLLTSIESIDGCAAQIEREEFVTC